MAISAPHAKLFRCLPLTRGGSLLEIGEAEWYGDVEPDFQCKGDSHAVAKAFYVSTFAPERIVSIDKHGSPAALQYDLNREMPQEAWDAWGHGFDVVINHGTAEHIFNIAKVFRTMHDACAVGGLMVHESPFTGWIDHGFYCLHPTLFYDLAAANCYEIVGVWLLEIKSNWTLRLDNRDHPAKLKAVGKLPDNCNLYACFRKLGERPFSIPMQGYYSNALSQQGKRAWRECR